MDVEYNAGTPWIQPKAPEELASLLRKHGRKARFKKRSQIVKPFEQVRHVYLVNKGVCQYYLNKANGNIQVVGLVTPGCCMGEIPSILSAFNLEGIFIRTLTDCEMYVLTFSEFHDLHKFSYESVIPFSLARFTSFMEGLAIIATSPPKERMEVFLRTAIKGMGVPPSGDWYRMPFTLSHSQLGEIIGANRVTVQRMMAGFAAKGLIRYEGKELYIHNSFVNTVYKL